MTDQHQTTPHLQQGYDAVVTMLSDFGYPSVTREIVKQAHETWQRGDQPDDIIERFAFDAFDKYPNIFGRPAA